MSMAVDPAFWRGKRVLLTGHMGFKGSWTALWLHAMGAHVSGLSLATDSTPRLFNLARMDEIVTGGMCDLRDSAKVAAIVAGARPQIVIHMAAQPLVRRSVAAPALTFETNVMGTLHLLEALRNAPGLLAVLAVTTDKVYENNEDGRPFKEHDPLGGHDPYSASKAAAEIVVQSYARTYFESAGIPVATARGGNVIGGGDFSQDRIVPDIWRAMKQGVPIKVRYPDATRPWQHVLDCIAGYICFTQALAERRTALRALNFGSDENEPLTVADLVGEMQAALGAPNGWVLDEGPKPREMQALSLDCSQARSELGWRNRLPGRAALTATAQWYLALERNEDMRAVTMRAIEEYQSS
jgi:CDP-glucose 4,6-dehydratase